MFLDTKFEKSALNYHKITLVTKFEKSALNCHKITLVTIEFEIYPLGYEGP